MLFPISQTNSSPLNLTPIPSLTGPIRGQIGRYGDTVGRSAKHPCTPITQNPAGHRRENQTSLTSKVCCCRGIELCSQVCLLQVDLLQVGLLQVGLLQVGLLQVGPLRIIPFQVPTLSVTPPLNHLSHTYCGDTNSTSNTHPVWLHNVCQVTNKRSQRARGGSLRHR